ncbi:hypothetical protein U2J37_27245, partial [Enterobacter hormaechei]|nr:hypothetical protein [Enterobacter hormaechei]
KSAQIREILISESAWEEMTCLFAPSLASTFEKLLKQLLTQTKKSARFFVITINEWRTGDKHLIVANILDRVPS